MSALRVPGPDGHIRLIYQGPSEPQLAHPFTGSMVEGRSGDSNTAAHAKRKRNGRQAKEAGR